MRPTIPATVLKAVSFTEFYNREARAIDSLSTALGDKALFNQLALPALRQMNQYLQAMPLKVYTTFSEPNGAARASLQCAINALNLLRSLVPQEGLSQQREFDRAQAAKASVLVCALFGSLALPSYLFRFWEQETETLWELGEEPLASFLAGRGSLELRLQEVLQPDDFRHTAALIAARVLPETLKTMLRAQPSKSYLRFVVAWLMGDFNAAHRHCRPLSNAMTMAQIITHEREVLNIAQKGGQTIADFSPAMAQLVKSALATRWKEQFKLTQEPRIVLNKTGLWILWPEGFEELSEMATERWPHVSLAFDAYRLLGYLLRAQVVESPPNFQVPEINVPSTTRSQHKRAKAFRLMNPEAMFDPQSEWAAAWAELPKNKDPIKTSLSESSSSQIKAYEPTATKAKKAPDSSSGLDPIAQVGIRETQKIIDSIPQDPEEPKEPVKKRSKFFTPSSIFGRLLRRLPFGKSKRQPTEPIELPEDHAAATLANLASSDNQPADQLSPEQPKEESPPTTPESPQEAPKKPRKTRTKKTTTPKTHAQKEENAA